jgi:O-antigen/teichoic acid export membrane protein
MADESRKTGSLGPTLLRSLQLITGLLWPVQIGLAVTAGPVIRFMYGDKWTMASTPLSFILIAQAIMLMFGMNWEVFTLTGNLRRQAKLEITRTALGAVAFLICAQFSLVAAAASRVLEALIGLFLYRGKIAELAKVEQSQLRRIYGEGALLTICAVLPVLILMMIWHWSALTPLAPLFACIGTGVALWLVGLHVLRHPLREEMQVIIRSVQGRLSTAAKG